MQPSLTAKPLSLIVFIILFFCTLVYTGCTKKSSIVGPEAKPAEFPYFAGNFLYLKHDPAQLVSFPAEEQHLDSIFIQHRNDSVFHTTTLTGEIYITQGRNSEMYAITALQKNDSTLFTNILHKNRQDWDTLISAIYTCHYTGIMPPSQWIILQDFSGDKIDDILFVTEHWDIHPGIKGQIWIAEKQGFSPLAHSTDIISPVYDYTNNTLVGYVSDGCSDYSMIFEVFTIKNDAVVKQSDLACDCCFAPGDSCMVKTGSEHFICSYANLYTHVPAVYSELVKKKMKD